jgi:GNAT superfamily N-acetyltransferase
MTRLVTLKPEQRDIAADVLCDAFHDYPVMRYVLGDAPGYRERLRTLIDFFVAARAMREEPMLIAYHGDTPAGAAIVSLPRDRPVPPALVTLREQTWRALGDPDRSRYEAFGAATGAFAVAEPHHHLNMIGVIRSHAGRGLARPLLEAVHDMSARDPQSTGVSLSTELERNVSLYEHFGYRRLGHVRVGEGLESWGFFRPND